MKSAFASFFGSLTVVASLLTVSVSGATVNRVYGGDAGEGLDMEGNFLYAINIGTSGGGEAVGDANFTADNIAGVTVEASDQIPTWGALDFGETANDNNLENVLLSIRHMYTSGMPHKPMIITLHGHEAGAEYKLQLLFRQQCCARAFDIFVNGTLILDDFNPSIEQGGVEANPCAGVAVSHEFAAQSVSLVISLDGTDVTPTYPDHNPILSGLTLERISAVGDSDNDNLPDDWEMKFFASLVQGPNDDPDNDGLNNATELSLGAFPNDSDSDKDGLSDGDEVNTHHSDPSKTDTDGDFLPDGREVTMYLTSPINADTDGDGWSDMAELRLLTNPADKNSHPLNPTATVFTGGDAGEGLDLDGQFLCAVNIGSADEPGQVRDAFFTSDAGQGFVVLSQYVAAGWRASQLSETDNDLALDIVMSAIRWSDVNNVARPNVVVELQNLVPGTLYKLQLLFGEVVWPHGFDISFNGVQIADDFAPYQFQGGFNIMNNGVVFTYQFAAADTTATVVLDGRGVTTPELTDHNAILQGFTLEDLGPAPTPPNIKAIAVGVAGVTVAFDSVAGRTYALAYKEQLADASWQEVPGAATATGASTALTDTNASHRAPAQGFWRVVMK